MAAKKGRSPVAALINGVGFLLAALLVAHIVFVLFHVPAEIALVRSVNQVAVPLAMFFPGMVQAHDAALQVLLDFGLAAGFWILAAGAVSRIFA